VPLACPIRRACWTFWLIASAICCHDSGWRAGKSAQLEWMSAPCGPSVPWCSHPWPLQARSRCGGGRESARLRPLSWRLSTPWSTAGKSCGARVVLSACCNERSVAVNCGTPRYRPSAGQRVSPRTVEKFPSSHHQTKMPPADLCSGMDSPSAAGQWWVTWGRGYPVASPPEA
jgi:hypothetical protein